MDLAAACSLLDGDFEFVNPDYAVEPGTRHGHDGFATVVENLDSSFDEQRHELGEVVGSRRPAAVAHDLSRTGRDSGAQIDIPEQHLWTMRNGKILRLGGSTTRPRPSRPPAAVSSLP